MGTIPKTEVKLSFDLTKLTENPDNPRVISKEGERKLDASLEEFGMLESVIVNKRADGVLMVVGGHQRLRRLLAAGHTVGMVTFVKVDLVAEKRLNLLLNGHHGSWDGEKLEAALRDLSDEGVVLQDLGLDGVAAFEQAMTVLADDAEALEEAGGATSETKEINPDGYELKHRCPKCGFEFDKPTTADGRRADGPGKRTVAGVRPPAANDDDG